MTYEKGATGKRMVYLDDFTTKNKSYGFNKIASICNILLKEFIEVKYEGDKCKPKAKIIQLPNGETYIELKHLGQCVGDKIFDIAKISFCSTLSSLASMKT